MPSKARSTGAIEKGRNGEVTDGRVLAGTLREVLRLRFPPVALAFVTEPPPGMEEFSGEVPSTCALWRRAEEGVFFASADAHYNCLVGAHAMGFSLPDALSEQLMQLVETMREVGYIDPAEVPNIPTVAGEKSGIVYGPLESFPLPADVVLVWVSPDAAMLLEESTGGSHWEADRVGIPTFGRPSCAAIGAALQRGEPALSLGCSGMRLFTGIDSDLQLAVLPRPALAHLAERVATITAANAKMREYYERRLEAVAGRSSGGRR